MALADIHVAPPWVTHARLSRIVAEANALRPDIVVLLGDYHGAHRFRMQAVDPDETARRLAGLSASLGVWAILGNHDWWDDASAQRRRAGPTYWHCVLRSAGIGVLDNDASLINAADGPFWLAGLGSQQAFRGGGWDGVDDLDATLAPIMNDDAPAILLAHEPDIFVRVPPRVALTLSGHTHGGQVRIFGHAPVVPSRFGDRYAYGHVVESHRHLIVSAGIGCSLAPIRFGSPPEIMVVELGP